MADSELSYTFTCPSCAGSFSILLERIPPVQARFRCPHCKQPMDFPSRDEARVYARLQEKPAPDPVSPAVASPPARAEASPVARVSAPAPAAAFAAPRDPSLPHLEEGSGAGSENVKFRIDRPGFEADVFDRRGMRNLIRSGGLEESDRVRMDDSPPVAAVDLPFLTSLFALRKTSRVMPPTCCRTHTERVAHFNCRDTARPLCEECCPEKKFGATVIRVCNHCGGTADELVAPTA